MMLRKKIGIVLAAIMVAVAVVSVADSASAAYEHWSFKMPSAYIFGIGDCWFAVC
jgi:hypothetical protein